MPFTVSHFVCLFPLEESEHSPSHTIVPQDIDWKVFKQFLEYFVVNIQTQQQT